MASDGGTGNDESEIMAQTIERHLLAARAAARYARAPLAGRAYAAMLAGARSAPRITAAHAYHQRSRAATLARAAPLKNKHGDGVGERRKKLAINVSAMKMRNENAMKSEKAASASQQRRRDCMLALAEQQPSAKRECQWRRLAKSRWQYRPSALAWALSMASAASDLKEAEVMASM
jgi:hypothetical protein